MKVELPGYGVRTFVGTFVGTSQFFRLRLKISAISFLDRPQLATEQLVQFPVAFGHPSLARVIHLHFLLQHEDELLAPVALQAFHARGRKRAQK